MTFNERKSVGLVSQPADDRQEVTGKHVRLLAEIQHDPLNRKYKLPFFIMDSFYTYALYEIKQTIDNKNSYYICLNNA